jgi:uncharacterized protein (TIGR00730 family)
MNEELGDKSNATKAAPALHETAARLARAITEGHTSMPAERPLLVCKPHKVESWRIFKIMSEFVEGFDLIRKYGLAVSFFGTSRASFDDSVYQHATELAARLSKQGFAVITGGAAGVMQAANKGAFEQGGASVGLNIRLPAGQSYNPYLTEKFEFEHFFVRKIMLTYASEVYVYFPGGFGTLDEFFEMITLIQTEKIRRVPVVLFGKSYWTPLVEFFEKVLYEKHKAIDKKDMDLFIVVDSVDEAFEYIVKNVTC